MIERDWAVAVLVVRNGHILLHRHRRLNRWLPPGGHVEPNEIPDDAAVREVQEETGVAIRLIGDSPNTVAQPGQPHQLIRPLGLQLADQRANHQHIDLVYLAEGLDEGDGRGRWFSASELPALDLGPELVAWCEIALAHSVRKH